MPSVEHAELIRGNAAACFAAVIDFESYPAWQSVVRSAEVQTRDEAGRGRDVAFTIDLKLRHIHYTLRYAYVEPDQVSWTYLHGDIRNVTGSYVFTETEPGLVQARYALNVDIGLPVPGLIRHRLEREVMRRSVQELKARVEAPSAS